MTTVTPRHRLYMIPYKISSKEDAISIRFLLGLEAKELSEILGLDNSSISKIEVSDRGVKLLHANALLGVCYFSPHSQYLLKKYERLNTKEYVGFLKTLTAKGNLPYSKCLKKCCKEASLTSVVIKGKKTLQGSRFIKEQDRLVAQCKNCGKESEATDTMLRKHLLRNRSAFKLYDESYYSMELWRKSKKTLNHSTKPEPLLTKFPINNENDLIKFRFLACLSQEQMGLITGLSKDAIARMELMNMRITTRHKFAFAAVYYYMTREFQGFDERYSKLNSTKAVETWLEFTNRSNLLPRVKRPECAQCGSIKLRMFKPKQRQGNKEKYGYECLECSYKTSGYNNYSIKRYYNLVHNTNIDMLSPKWFLTSDK